jgi:hypothetical protein
MPTKVGAKYERSLYILHTLHHEFRLSVLVLSDKRSICDLIASLLTFSGIEGFTDRCDRNIEVFWSKARRSVGNLFGDISITQPVTYEHVSATNFHVCFMTGSYSSEANRDAIAGRAMLLLFNSNPEPLAVLALSV